MDMTEIVGGALCHYDELIGQKSYEVVDVN